MNNEQGFFPKQEQTKTQETFKHNGKLNLTDQEQELLLQEIQEQFEQHPTLKGVEIRNIDTGRIPASVQEKIEAVGGSITSFSAVKIQKQVPLHKHTADGEMYFGDGDVSVRLLDASRNEIGTFELHDHAYTLTAIGEWHEATNQREMASTFFGVKFVTENAEND